jgi:hypothetical protein
MCLFRDNFCTMYSWPGAIEGATKNVEPQVGVPTVELKGKADLSASLLDHNVSSVFSGMTVGYDLNLLFPSICEYLDM